MTIDSQTLALILQVAQQFPKILKKEELFKRLSQIILAQSNAECCTILHPLPEKGWKVSAIATTTTFRDCSEALELQTDIPLQLIQTVQETCQPVLVKGGMKAHTPLKEEALNQQGSKSILCLPMLEQQELMGIIYLYHSSRSDVFAKERLPLLDIVCRQAASSLVNIHRYNQMQQDAQQLSARLQTSERAQAKLVDSENLLQQQATALFQLTQSQAISQGQLDLALRELTEAISRLILVERVSIWLINDDGTKFECADLFQRTERQHISGYELEADRYPVYFSAVMSTPIVAANDARTDARTNEFLKGYLDVLDIYSMLDASIYVAGKVKGVICCEQVGTPRVWRPSEQNFVRSIANLVALTLETHQRQQNTQQLELALSQLEESQLQLVQAEKMASLGNLIAGVAHEINNPVGFLKGSVGNAKDYLKDLLDHLELYQDLYPNMNGRIQENAEDIDLDFLRDDFPKLFDSMQSATNRIQVISNSLRTFSRADTEYKVSADVQEGLESTILILKYRLKANDLRPEIQVIKDYRELPLIECFSGRLNQVFMNLLANAIDVFDESAEKASFADLTAKPQLITIKTVMLSEQNAIEIRISDNGQGMPESVKARIFDHLFTTKGVGKGTGLGLAIARQIIVEAHGGTIEVHSELGQGTEFCIQLPL